MALDLVPLLLACVPLVRGTEVELRPASFPDEALRRQLAAPRTEEILKALPQATNQVALIARVDELAWKRVTDELPFRVEFRELAPQSLHVVHDDRAPLGLIQVRCEEGAWGVVELTWVWELDLTVRDLVVRRCRDRNRGAIENEAFVDQLRGLSRIDLLELLDPQQGTLRRGALTVHEDAVTLAALVVRSAIKGLAFTEALWSEGLVEWRVQQEAWRRLPDAASVVLSRAKVRVPLATPAAEDEIRDVVIARSVDARERLLGIVTHTRLAPLDDTSLSALWVVTPQHAVLEVVPTFPWRAGEVESRACRSLRGRRLEEISVSEGPARTAARMILAVTRTGDVTHVR